MLVVMTCLAMVVRRLLVVRGCLVMVFAGRMFAQHDAPHLWVCGYLVINHHEKCLEVAQ